MDDFFVKVFLFFEILGELKVIYIFGLYEFL